MASLNNQKIKDTYEGLIKTNDNAAISSEVELTDGAGNSTGVSVSNDGRVVASGTVSFGSLKDTGEDITITKFVDEADGIANNDNDTSIPTTAAVKDYVDSTELNSVTSVNTQTGDVVLDTDNIDEGSSNLYYTEARVSANTSVAANTLKNSYPSADATKLSGIESGADVTDTDNVTTALNNISIQQHSDVSDATPQNNQVLQYSTTTSKFELTTLSTTAPVDSVNGQTGAVVLDTDDISEGSTNLYYTEARVSANTDVTANTAKNSYPTADATKLAGIEAGAEVNPTSTDGLTEGSTNLYYTEARVAANSAVAANTAKVGITTAQADAIVANTSKNSYPTADATKLAGIEAGAEVNPTSTDELSEGSTNLYYTDARVSANTDVAANTAKNSYPSADATKVGFISVTQAVNLDTIESDVATNNAKISFDSASSTKLAGIEAGAQVNRVDSVNTQTGAVVLDADDIDDTSTTNKWSTTAEKTKLGYISVTQAVDLDSIEQKQNSQFKAIGLATDFGFRVLSDSGKVEGTQCIMENMEILILN